MIRFRCAELIKAKLAADDIVVCGLGSVEAAYKQVGPAGPTYFASDPMGLWPSIALGLALARPDRRVVLLAGDGDLLMNLQVLATIATVAPKNFRIVLFQNGSYASSGGQSLGAVDGLSFATILKAPDSPGHSRRGRRKTRAENSRNCSAEMVWVSWQYTYSAIFPGANGLGRGHRRKSVPYSCAASSRDNGAH